MNKGYQFTQEELECIQKRMKNEKNKNVYRKLQVLELRAKGFKINEVAEITGYHQARVSQLVTLYRKDGLEAYAQDKRKGGNRQLLTYEAEEELLKPFTTLADEGGLITVATIHKAFEKAVGHSLSPSATYKMLKRHGWRKIMPRSQHPKGADAETIDASKKLTKNSEMREIASKGMVKSV